MYQIERTYLVCLPYHNLEIRERWRDVANEEMKEKFCVLELDGDNAFKLKVHMRNYKLDTVRGLFSGALQQYMEENSEMLNWLDADEVASNTSSAALLLWRTHSLHHKASVKRVRKEKGEEGNRASFHRVIQEAARKYKVEGLVRNIKSLALPLEYI